MQVETLKNVIQRTQSYYHQLALCINRCNTKRSKRTKYLLDCLANYEDILLFMIPTSTASLCSVSGIINALRLRQREPRICR